MVRRSRGERAVPAYSELERRAGTENILLFVGMKFLMDSYIPLRGHFVWVFLWTRKWIGKNNVNSRQIIAVLKHPFLNGEECLRAYGGCLGFRKAMKDAAWRRYASGRCQATFDPEMSEWGNPIEQTSMIAQRCARYTLGSETSQYQEEKKLISISSVAASESESAQTAELPKLLRICGVVRVILRVVRH